MGRAKERENKAKREKQEKRVMLGGGREKENQVQGEVRGENVKREKKELSALESKREAVGVFECGKGTCIKDCLKAKRWGSQA